ncbi:aminoglycoside adenylyltransferase domain-containing protein [Nocardioides sp.]|uniref:aminoglycoside adenylyltransferase domain-containing protein n=1 Tax=Nocardioides sp. TaxID=35761 RepID=UPI00286D1FEA|nr:aminoglycoside adenylyltransferase domain-containing protein [Nocardioides sp.]
MDPGLLAHLEPQVGPASAADLVGVLRALDRGARDALGDEVVGLHLVGSFATGDADEHSDVDVIVVTRTAPTPAAEAALTTLHAHLPDLGSSWARHLEGSYAPAPDLANPTTVGRRWLHVDHGSRVLERSAHDNTAHTRWVLRERALTVSGTPALDLLPRVSRGMLFAEAVGEARQRAAAVEDHPASLGNAGRQPSLVLTMCRILYTAREGAVVGKEPAARWALAILPAQWHDLVLAAVADRSDPWGRVHREADPDRALRTRAFVWDVLALVSASR